MIRCITTLIVISVVTWSTSTAQASHVKTRVALDLTPSVAVLHATSHRSIDRSEVDQLARHVRHRRVVRPRGYHHHRPHPTVRHHVPYRYPHPVPRPVYYPARRGGVGVYGPNVSLWIGF